MTTFAQPLKEWQSLHELSLKMLDLARQEEWDALIEQEMKYLQVVDNIAQNPIPQSSARESEQARLILEKVLANEEELKGLLQVRMEELRLLINKTGNQRSVTTAYGKHAGNILFPDFPPQ
jgi:Flagellar protein FliT.